jgi:large subunit ribosomal protein L18
MADKNTRKAFRADRRRRRVRAKVKGTSACPRLTVSRSLTNIYAQIIDDEKEVTVVAASSISANVADSLSKEMKKIEVAKKVGEVIAKAAQEKGVTSVVFDRNVYRYHGRIKAVADGAREAGLKF